MNCEICHLKELEVEVFQVREVLRCILHTILFHRALGLIRPKDVDSEHFEITYVQCGDAELEKKIEERIDHFYGWVEKHPNKKGQVLLSFYEVKNKQASWFTNKVERLYWEQWYINLHIVQPNVHGKSSNTKTALDPGGHSKEETSSRRTSLETSLREVLFQIIKFVNEKKDHIPPVPNLDCVSFPYEITVPRSPLLYPSCDVSFVISLYDWPTNILLQHLNLSELALFMIFVLNADFVFEILLSAILIHHLA